MKLVDVEELMQKAVQATQRNFNTIRTGRASSALLDRVLVDYYGTPTGLKSLATISTPDSSTILIQPFDRGSLANVERAISTSDLGLTPNNDGKVIRLNIPPLTEERRKDLVKMVGKLAEEGRVSIRNIRRDAIESIRKLEKNSELSKDEAADRQDEIQKLTDRYVKEIEDISQEKQTEITTV